MVDSSTAQAQTARLPRVLRGEAEGRAARRQPVQLQAGEFDQELADRHRRELAEGAARLAEAEDLNAQLRASEEFARRVLAATTDGISVLDLEGRLISMNASAVTALGRDDASRLLGTPWFDLWQTSPSYEAVCVALKLAGSGRTSRFQSAFGANESGTLWWDVVVAPVNGAEGRPDRILVVSRDISELKQNEARQAILMQEMAHRMKNTLAMVQAVATQTLRNAESLDEAGEALSARLLALSQAQDVLMQGAWASADLHSLVGNAVSLHGDGEPDRFRVHGPELTLGPKPGLTLALMLHELGTNAAKYGALSRPDGHVAISWEIEQEGEEQRLHFRWEEIGGPRVEPPTRVGFGTRLIERSLVHSFGGRAALDFQPDGVVLTMEAPLTAVLAPNLGL